MICKTIRREPQKVITLAPEAFGRENMRFVPIKTDDQLDLQAIHRVRDRLITRRTAVINQLRAFLLERGITFAKSPASLRKGMPGGLEDADSNLTPRMRSLLELLWSEWKILEGQLDGLNDDLERIASADDACRRLRQIPGIGPLISTAIVAAIGNGAAFHKGRDFAAWLGEACTEGSTRLVEKRGCSASASAATVIYAIF